MKNMIDQLKGIIAEAEAEVVKFVDKGNMAASTRIRLAMQNLKKTADAVRKEVMTKRDELKAAKDAKKK